MRGDVSLWWGRSGVYVYGGKKGEGKRKKKKKIEREKTKLVLFIYSLCFVWCKV